MSLHDALSGVRHLLVDFDGPFCSMFAGLPADEVAQRMRRQLADAGHPPLQGWDEENDPFSLLLRIADEAPALVAVADAVLGDLETEAAALARPNPDIDGVIDAASRTGRSVVVVSNNAGRAIESYLVKHAMTERISGVIGRVPGDPSSMKPSPRLLLDAMGHCMGGDLVFIGDSAREFVFIGDAVRDVEAGHAAGIATIGYANKPRKERSLADAGAVAVVTSLIDIAEALASKV